MHLGVGDYYSLSSGTYKKHPQVEVIGVDSLQPYSTQQPPIASYSSEKQIKRSVIKQQEQMEYERQQEINQRLYNTIKLKDLQEVNSQYTKQHNSDRNHLVYSCIDKKNKGVPLKKLDEIHRSISQSAESNLQDQEQKKLYFELQKEKKIRMELQRSYRALLSQVNQKSEEPTMRKNASNVTVGCERNTKTHETEQHESANSSRGITDRKTVKISEYDKNPRNIEDQSEQEEQYITCVDPIQIRQNQESSDAEECYQSRKKLLTQQSAQFLEDYMNQQRQFQSRMIYVVENLHQKVEEIDQYLFAKQEAQKQAQFDRILAEKQEQIRKIEEENQRLRQKAQKSKSQEYQANPRDILTNLSPNSLYFFCIILMVIIAIA